MRAGLAAMALFVLCAARAAAELPPIPPEAWDVKEADSKGSGAIILERTLRFDAQYIEHSYLIRVLSEQGKAAVEFARFAESAKIEGRTVTREGVETPFKASEDFLTKALVKTETGTLNQKAVVPPGLTPDCVVQIQWRESASFLAVGGYWDYNVQDRIFSLASTLPIRKMTLEVNDSVGWAYDLQTGPRGSQIVNGKGSRSAIFTHLPAYEWIPFSEASAKDNPKFVLYQQPRFLMTEAAKGTQAYWNMVAKDWWGPYYDGKVQYGKLWGGFYDDICKDLPTSKQAAALELHRRVLARVKDTSALLPEEVAARSAKEAKRKIDSRDFGESLKTGETNHNGILLLYWDLLKKADIPVKPVLVVDRGERQFRLKQCNLAQFDRTLFLIEEPGKEPLFLEPARRFAAPDIIHPRHQGTDALALVPGTPWTYQVVKIPFQVLGDNARRSDIQIDVSEEKDRIHLTSTFTGIRDWTERGQWRVLMPEQRKAGLKDALAKIDPGVQIEGVSIGDIQKTPFGWSADAVRERDASRRLEVIPFPLLEAPLFLPKDLPTLRLEPIVLTQGGTDEIRSVIQVPAGYQFAGMPDFNQSNSFGEVMWTATPVTGKVPAEVIVTCKVSTKSLVSEPSRYPQFKAFLGWVAETFNRKVILNRVPR